jgi:hypothetical protein
MARLLLISYIALGIVLIATLAVLSFDIPYLTSSSVKNFSMNLATEVIGIGLTIFLVDRVIEKQQEAELKRYRQVALQRLRTPLARHVDFLFQMFKATVETKPQNDLVEVSDLFNKTFFANVAFLDFFKPAPISSALVGSPNWATYLVMESKSLNDSLGQILDKYSVYVDVELIELIEEMLDKKFYRIVAVLQDEVTAGIHRGVTQPYPGFINLTKHIVEPHVWSFQDLIHYFNSQVSNEHKINLKGQTWRNDVSPPVGSARASLPKS